MTSKWKTESSLARQALGVFAISAAILAAAPNPTHAQGAGIPDREITTQVGALPEDTLKQFYMHCSQKASEHVLGLGEAALCSVVYETLLNRVFEGDFHALLAWSRVQPHHALATEPPLVLRTGTAGGSAR